MGTGASGHCKACGHGFSLMMGGGFERVNVFCEDCGQATSLYHGREPLPETEGDPGCVGHCKCGGRLAYTAKPGCPRCQSRELVMEDTCFHWD
jgi:hypothetical protein